MAMKEYELNNMATGSPVREDHGFLGPGGMSPPVGMQKPLPEVPMAEAGGLQYQHRPPPTTSTWCGCLSVAYYQRFFDVDTRDIRDRWLHSLYICRRGASFLEEIGERADAYGPFWNATTLIFLIALTTNMASWMAWDSSSSDPWEYDFKKLVKCTSIVYGFAAGVPLVSWVVLGQIEVKLSLMQVLCTYGYSLGAFLPAVLFCTIPNGYVVWAMLAAATAVSIVFLLRSLAPAVLESNHAWTALIMAALGATQVLFMLLLKFLFYNY